MLSTVYCLLLLLIANCIGGVAQASEHADGPVTAARQLMLENQHIYVSPGSGGTDQAFEALWNSGVEIGLDSYRQPWRRINLSALEAVVGPIPRRYAIVHAEYMEAFPHCDRPLGCTPLIRSLQVAEAEVHSASMFRWGCDETLVTVLDLGQWPWDHSYEWPSAVALALSPFEMPVEQAVLVGDLLQELPADKRPWVAPGVLGVHMALPKSGGIFKLFYYSTGNRNVFVIKQRSDANSEDVVETDTIFPGAC